MTADIVINPGTIAADGTYTAKNGESIRSWTPIRPSKNNLYSGTIDGQCHTISGLYVNASTTSYIGFVACLYNGIIKNLGIVNSYFNGQGAVGSLAGKNAGTITNCYSLASVKATRLVCGITYLNAYGKISNCYFAGTVSSGIPIANTDATGSSVSNCYYLSTSGTSGGGTSKTAEQFASGEVAYLLNGSKTSESSVWHQTLGENGDNYPVLDTKHGLVYKACLNYKNRPAEDTDHDYDDGVPTDPTCTAVGYITYTCNKCGDSYTVEGEPATGEHSYDNGFCIGCGGYQEAMQASDGYYEISNAGQLYWFRQTQRGTTSTLNARLTADIVINPGTIAADGTYTAKKDESIRSWTPIYHSGSYQYYGTIDGQGHTISGIYVNAGSTEYIGFVAFLYTGTIKNLGIVNSYFNGIAEVGSFAGKNSNGTITNCYSFASVKGSSYVYGISYLDTSGKISNCYFAGTVSSVIPISNTGATYSSVSNCYYLSTSGTSGGGTSKTAEQFASGEVAYLLNGSKNSGSLAWGQTLEADAYPTLNGGGVNSYARTMSNEWGTLVVPFAITYDASNTDYKLYQFTKATSDALTFSEYADGTVIPAGMPMAIRATGAKNADGKYDVRISMTGADFSTTITTPDAVNGLTMKGTYSQLTNQTGMYFIAANQFWWAEDPITINPFRAWFEGSLSAGAKALSIVVEENGETTTVGTLQDGELRNGKYVENHRIVIYQNGRKYNINGQVME